MLYKFNCPYDLYFCSPDGFFGLKDGTITKLSGEIMAKKSKGKMPEKKPGKGKC